MFFVNTYRWDFPMVAALIAPRPLLIVNMMFSGSSDGEWFVRAQAVSAATSYHPPLESTRPTITGVEPGKPGVTDDAVQEGQTLTYNVSLSNPASSPTCCA